MSPDQGATGETTTSSGSMEAGTQTGLSEEEEEAHYKEEYRNDVIKLLKNISMQDPELGRDIVMEALLKHFAAENRSKGSEKPDRLILDNLEALSSKYLETSGCVPNWLKQDLKDAREDVEFENYMTLLKETRARFGCETECVVIPYILKHKGHAYYQILRMSCSHREK